jgi:hypothetical protein
MLYIRFIFRTLVEPNSMAGFAADNDRCKSMEQRQRETGAIARTLKAGVL